MPAFAQALAERHGEHEWQSMMSKTALLMKDLGHTHLSDQDFIKIEHAVKLGLGGLDNMVSFEETEYTQRLVKNSELCIYDNVQHPIEKVPMELLVSEINNWFVEINI